MHICVAFSALSPPQFSSPPAFPRQLSPAVPLYCFDMADLFPAIQGGGSLILAWQVRNKRVLVVGGGEVGACSLAPALSEY